MRRRRMGPVLAAALVVIARGAVVASQQLAGGTPKASDALGHGHSGERSCVLSGPTGPGPPRHRDHVRQRPLTRDNPNVPSDLEQIPSLLNFMKQNGALAIKRAHAPDRAHRRRHPDDAHRRLRNHARSAGDERLPHLQHAARRAATRRARSPTGPTR